MRFVVLVVSLLLFVQSSTALPEADLISLKVFPLFETRISSTYGPRKHPVRKYTSHHNGVDFAAPPYAHIRAVTDGTVIFSGKHGGFGKLVTISHPNGFATLYGHLDELNVSIGSRVVAGQIIGRVGATGTATGPHLHFEVRKDGKPIDPLILFPELRAEAEG